MIRVVILAGSFLLACWSAAAWSQPPQFFYCYASNAKTGTVFFSDMHRVGPVAERSSYGKGYANYLAAKGKVPSGTQGYCVMRPSEAEIERGQRELPERCDECGSADNFEQVAWLRQGKDLGVLLAGKLDRKPPPAASAAESTETQKEEPPAGAGVYAWGARGETDIVMSINESNGRTLSRLQADLKGGKWTNILSDDRCPGWGAISYASNGEERRYFVARGAEDEGEASRKALEHAERTAEREEGEWTTGVLQAYFNDYQPAERDFSGSLIQIAKDEVRRMVTSGCARDETRLTTFGVRG